MEITYDPEADAMSIRFQKGKYHVSKEMGEGIIMDYTKSGKLLSIEILDVQKRMPIKNIQHTTVQITHKGQLV